MDNTTASNAAWSATVPMDNLSFPQVLDISKTTPAYPLAGSIARDAWDVNCMHLG